MSGHSHWKQIKEQKGSTDKKRGALFSKLLRSVTIAAKNEPNPDFNPRLRSAVQDARDAGVASDTVERAVHRASAEDRNLEEVVCEAYGPGGTAIILKGVTDSKNRTIMEIKILLKEHGGKWADPGSVRWAFEESLSGFTPKFPQALSPEERPKLETLLKALSDHDDVVLVVTNIIQSAR